MQKTKEEEFLKLFDRWKEEEKEKLVGEMEKVKEMFMKEFKELTSKNSALEYVSIKPKSPHNIGRVVALRGGVRLALWPADLEITSLCPDTPLPESGEGTQDIQKTEQVSKGVFESGSFGPKRMCRTLGTFEGLLAGSVTGARTLDLRVASSSPTLGGDII